MPSKSPADQLASLFPWWLSASGPMTTAIKRQHADHDPSTGGHPITSDDLHALADAVKGLEAKRYTVTIGHPEPRFQTDDFLTIHREDNT